MQGLARIKLKLASFPGVYSKSMAPYVFLAREGHAYCFRSLDECRRYAAASRDVVLISFGYVDVWLGLHPGIVPRAKSADAKVVAYVDGSFMGGKQQAYAWGVVLWPSKGKHRKAADSIIDVGKQSMRNISGETLASWIAIEAALRTGYKTIEIRHDYDGLSVRHRKGGKPKPEVGQYRAYLREADKKASISFVKISHKPSANQAHRIAYSTAQRGLGKLQPVAKGLRYRNNEAMIDRATTDVESFRASLLDAMRTDG